MLQKVTTKALRYPGLPSEDFLYGDDTPWPRENWPHYDGLAPAIEPIPEAERKDWSANVGAYYQNTLIHFGPRAAFDMIDDVIDNKPTYPDLSDETFRRIMTEGLYSKFLSPLDPRDRVIFRSLIVDEDRYLYLTSDQTALRVIRRPWPGEAVAPSITLVRRRKDDSEFNYEIIGIMLQAWNDATQQFDQSDILRPGDGDAWNVARYFVLQGAIHRINLIDHPGVHFPADTINALTKSVLPKSNLILRLLRPHMWLSLPVNNAVLDGDKSIINPNTWYPWCPFVAKGSEVQKLLPFCWYGAKYYATGGPASAEGATDAWFDEADTSYLPYRYDPAPPEIPSQYGEFLRAYFVPIRKFCRGVIDFMTEKDWQEAAFWADQIAPILPGHPDGAALIGTDGLARNKDLLADLCAHFIWNAAIMHSADHEKLHEMFAGRTDNSGGPNHPPLPVPFVMRVKPPMNRKYKREHVLQHAPDASYPNMFLRIVQKIAGFLDRLSRQTPLSWPTDHMAAELADALFYKPHNSLCILAVEPGSPGADGNRTYAGFDTAEMAPLVRSFHADLVALDADLAKQPRRHVVPLSDIAAGVQY
jgi:hypothetical protein